MKSSEGPWTVRFDYGYSAIRPYVLERRDRYHSKGVKAFLEELALEFQTERIAWLREQETAGITLSIQVDIHAMNEDQGASAVFTFERMEDAALFKLFHC